MTTAHLDHDALADLAEGILDEAAATSAEAHLADCADCRDRAAEIAEVSRVLAEAPAPQMPSHLVERLDAAIAAEAASRMPEAHQPRRYRILAAAAAAVVAVGGGAAVARTLLSDSTSKSTAVSQHPADEPSRPRATDARQQQALRPVPYSAVHSGTKYTRTQLATQVASALTASPPTARLLVSGPLDGCIRRVSSGKAPLLVDSATFDGAPATIIALPASDARHADVWVVGPACSLTDPDPIVHTLTTR